MVRWDEPALHAGGMEILSAIGATAVIGGFWPAMARPRLTHKRHGARPLFGGNVHLDQRVPAAAFARQVFSKG